MTHDDRYLIRLLHQLTSDPWRQSCGFSSEIGSTQRIMWSNAGRRNRTRALMQWIGSHQPCMFARYAAKSGLFECKIIDEDDLLCGDDHIRRAIQGSHRVWLRGAFEGTKLGYVLAVSSPKIAQAVPNDAVRKLAMRILSIILNRQVECDALMLDRVFLQHPSNPNLALCWETPVNFFSVHGDKRWWSDRRFPCGFGFSINSVGLGVASGLLDKDVAVKWAERTILASNQCEMTDRHTYQSKFHSDHALPSAFFDPMSPAAGVRSLSLTTRFDTHQRDNSAGRSWDHIDERSDGRPLVVSRREALRHLEEAT